MSATRKHSCVPVAPPRKRQINRPRRVIPSGGAKLKQTDNLSPPTSARCASASSTRGPDRSGRSDTSELYWNMVRSSFETKAHPHGLSGGDASYSAGLMSKISSRPKLVLAEDEEISGKIKIANNKFMKKDSNTNLLESKRPMGFKKETNKKHGNMTVPDQMHVPLRKSSSKISPESETLHEIYRNHNFKMPSDHALRCNSDNWATCIVDSCKRTLGPIPETTETTCSRASVGIHRSGLPEKKLSPNQSYIKSEVEFKDIPVRHDMSDVTQFRNKFFFECHSAKDMLRRKASALKDADHRCSYRFYLNERLFPVPLCSDHENTIRCTDCCLPMQLDPSSNSQPRSGENETNRTIQAKICIGREKELKDIILLLPAKDNLLVLEKHKNSKEVLDENAVHFGILRIDNRRPTLGRLAVPDNSFALRYQKGYRKFQDTSKIRLTEADKDIIYL